MAFNALEEILESNLFDLQERSLHNTSFLLTKIFEYNLYIYFENIGLPQLWNVCNYDQNEMSLIMI